MKTWAVWLTGLPGSGKSAVARELEMLLKGIKVQVLSLDRLRKTLTPKARYTEDERDAVYSTLILIGELLIKNDVNVIIDATAHRRRWRESARKKFENFLEVYIKCPLEICIERESNRKDNLVVSELYRKALERLRYGKEQERLGEVIGIDVPYEEPEKPEIVIESNKVRPNEGARLILEEMKRLGYI